MRIFDGKIPRYLILTISSYGLLYALSYGQLIITQNNPSNTTPNIERRIEQKPTPDVPKLENEILKEQPKPVPDKYGPQWQEKIRKMYTTELV